tara:strand:+ start:160 stop:1083 length:924 start_codon:yes stop_codon:yes gene_type:complete
MQILSHLKEIDENLGPFGITLGNFDGFHLGHTEFLKFMQKDCKNLGLNPIVITFMPHPRLVLDSTKPFLITDYHEKRNIFLQRGFKYLLEIEFNKSLSVMDTTDFLNNYLFCLKNIEKIYLGHDFSFGKNKSMGPDLVIKYCHEKKKKYHFQDEYIFSGENVSSSRIRNLLNEGSIEDANQLLGREYFMTGAVIRGHGRGRKIGIPTVNLEISPHKLIPSEGVYFSISEIDGKNFQSITNIGFKPTFPNEQKTVETHLLDFNSDLYGKEIKVKLLKKLRDEIKFSGSEELVLRIKKDIQMAKDFFKK